MAYLYKGYKCHHNISIHIVLYDPFSNLSLIELLRVIKPVKGHTSLITLYCQRTSTIFQNFFCSLRKFNLQVTTVFPNV